MTSGCGGRKFFFPRTMKDPVGRYSPLGAVFDTCTSEEAGLATHACHTASAHAAIQSHDGGRSSSVHLISTITHIPIELCTMAALLMLLHYCHQH